MSDRAGIGRPVNEQNERDLVVDTARQAIRRWVDLARHGPWPGSAPRHLAWGADDLVQHVGTIVEYFALMTGDTPTGVESLAGVTQRNTIEIASREGEPWPISIGLVDGPGNAVLDRLAERDAPLKWHGAISVSPAEATALFAAEFLVHRYDIERTLGRRTTLSSSEVRPLIAPLSRIMPHALDRPASLGLDLRCRVKVRGVVPFDIVVRDEQMSVGDVRERPDCVVYAAAAPFLLLVYGRRTIARYMPTGQVVAAGRAPWRALRLPRLIAVP